MNKKSILKYSGIFALGVISGGILVFFLLSDINRQFIKYHTINMALYKVSRNTQILSDLRNPNIDKAINSLELDLDVAIVELHSRVKDDDVSINDKNEIEDKLKYVKNYRSEYPRDFNDAETKKIVEDALSDIPN